MRKYRDIQPKIAESAYIDPDAAVIGNVKIGADSSIWPMCTLRADVNIIRIGTRTNIQDGSILHLTGDNRFFPDGHSLLIGNEVTVGHGAILHGCQLHDLCLIGMGAIVLDAAVVESHAMVAAGALVPPGKRIESGYLWVGSPAKKTRALTDRELEYLSFSAADYVRVKNHFMHG